MNLWQCSIYGTPITKKNSQRIFKRGDGTPFITTSRQYKEYAESCGWYIIPPREPIKKPVNVACVYYMPTKRRVDLVNLQEATLDILVRYRVLEDDNCNIVYSMDGSKVILGAEKARVEICIKEICDG